MRLHGVMDEVLTSALDRYVSAVEANAQGVLTAEHASGSLLPPTLEPKYRSDVLLDFEPPVVAALSALIHSRLAVLLAACLGPALASKSTLMSTTTATQTT